MSIIQGELWWGLSKEANEFLRPKDLLIKLGINHNWGSWFYFKDHTIIRIFGSHVVPRLLLIIALGKIAF